MDNQLYRGTVKSLGISIFLLELAIAGAALLIVFTLQDSLRILSIIGLWDEDFGKNLWIAWLIVALPLIAVAWAEFVFLPKARTLLKSDKPSEAFGESTLDELVELNEIRGIVNKFAIFLVAEAIAIGLFIDVAFVNVVLATALLATLIGLLAFFRDKAKILKAEKTLLS